MDSKKNLAKSKVLYNSESEDDEENELNKTETINQVTPSLEQNAPSNQDSPNEIKVKVTKEKVKHICSECKKEFARKWFLDRHISELRCEVIREKTKQRDIEVRAREMKDKEKEERRIKREEKKRLKEAEEIRLQKEEMKKQKKMQREQPVQAVHQAVHQPVQPVHQIQQPKPIRPSIKISF